MTSREDATFWVKIYVSGPIDVIEQTCREFVSNKGLCVTVDSTKFIYTGGEEAGAVVGLINYPKFPKDQNEILEIASELSGHIMRNTYQDSILIMTPYSTIWTSKRDIPS